MEYRPFGATGLEVSAIGFGCQEMGGGYGRIEETEFAHAVGADSIRDQRLRHGGGVRLRRFGAGARAGAWQPSRRSHRLHQVRHGIRRQAELPRREPRAVRASIDQSLKNLGTDYVDVYFVHWPDRQIPYEETMSALDDVVREGKVRFVGVSNFTRDDIVGA